MLKAITIKDDEHFLIQISSVVDFEDTDCEFTYEKNEDCKTI